LRSQDLGLPGSQLCCVNAFILGGAASQTVEIERVSEEELDDPLPGDAEGSSRHKWIAGIWAPQSRIADATSNPIEMR